MPTAMTRSGNRPGCRIERSCCLKMRRRDCPSPRQKSLQARSSPELSDRMQKNRFRAPAHWTTPANNGKTGGSEALRCRHNYTCCSGKEARWRPRTLQPEQIQKLLADIPKPGWTHLKTGDEKMIDSGVMASTLPAPSQKLGENVTVRLAETNKTK